VARWQPTATAALGLFATDALAIGPACATAQANGSGDRPARCDVLTGSAVAVDWNLRSADSEWFLRGQLTGSRYAGGAFSAQEDPASGLPLALAPRRVLADGTVLRPGDLGGGGFLAFGRNGGEPWRLDVDLEYESPRLELNAVGFQRTQNEARLRPIVRYVRPTGSGPFHSLAHGLGADLRATSDGQWRRRSATFFYFNELQLRTFQTFGCEVDLDLAGDDVREIDRTGIAFARAGSWNTNCYVNSDQSKPVYLEAYAGHGASFAVGPGVGAPYGGTGGLISVRPHPSVETRVAVSYESNRWPFRWVETTASGDQLFAGLRAPLVSVSMRQLLLLTPRLTFQLYGQLLVASGRYGPYALGWAPAGGRIRAADLVPGGAPAADPDFHRTELNLSALLRWEYRLGSTLFLVYSRSAAEPGLVAGQRPGAGLSPSGLSRGPTSDTVLAKWTWYWSS
jgi:hypothetical protein